MKPSSNTFDSDALSDLCAAVTICPYAGRDHHRDIDCANQQAVHHSASIVQKLCYAPTISSICSLKELTPSHFGVSLCDIGTTAGAIRCRRLRAGRFNPGTARWNKMG